MRVTYGQEWKRYFSKISRYHKGITNDTVDFFIEDPYHPSLRNHPLDPPLERYRTISVDGDLRILFRMIDTDTVLFLKIGTHDEIYTRVEK